MIRDNEPIILAIDTSCDETSASVVKGLTVLSNVLPSQMEFHKKYGGVVPSLAKFAHEERIDQVVDEALQKSGLRIEEMDAIAVTQGPGLAIALEVGIKKAKELATKYNKPLIAINHMEGHLLSALAERSSKSKILNPKTRGHDPLNNAKVQSPRSNDPNSKFQIPNSKSIFNSQLSIFNFPIIGFLISGGHTELILVKNFGEYEKIGDTLDDSCGEAYDKCGRIIGLGYPAGPAISEFAKRHRNEMDMKLIKKNKSLVVLGINKKSRAEYALPVSMANSPDLNFSFSGLKTAFRYLVNNLTQSEITIKDQLEGEVKGLTKEQIMDLCTVFETAALTQLSIKLEKAIKMYEPKKVLLGGGVVASARLRAVLRSVCKKYKVPMLYPYSKKLTSDNAAMIGVAASIKIENEKLKIENNKISNSKFQILNSKEFDQVDREPNLSL